MTRLGLLASTAVCAASMASHAAWAFPSSRLIYSRGEGAERCPDEATMRKAVARRLGYDPFFPHAEKTIVSQIVRDRGVLRGSVQLVDDGGIVRGQRNFEVDAGDCDELVAAMSLAISIAIDPTRASLAPAPVARPSDPPAPEAGTSEKLDPATAEKPGPRGPAVRPDAAVSPSRAPSPAREDSFTIEPGVSVTTSTGTAPSLAIGAAVSLGIRFLDASLFVDGRRDLPATSEATGGGRLQTSLWVVSVAPCLNRDVFFVCAVGSLGSLRAEGIELAAPKSDSALYAAAGGRLGLEARLFRAIYFRPQLDLLATLARAELQLDGTTRWTAPRYSALLEAGLFAHFP